MQALLVNKMVCPSSDGYVRLPSGRFEIRVRSTCTFPWIMDMENPDDITRVCSWSQTQAKLTQQASRPFL